MRSLQPPFTVLAALLLAGCSSPHDEPRQLTLATTTSTRDSGLLDILAPMFQESTGVDLKVIAVGTGQALELGRRGDADVLLTHAPDAEREFMAEGFGEGRREVMYNEFAVVGPLDDPARVNGEKSVIEAMRRIAESGSLFVSRGDNSGTHMKEEEIWSKAGVAPRADWRLRAGSGMAATLRLADEKRAYTLADLGTFLSQRENLELVVLSQGDPLLHNVYSVMAVNPAKHPRVRHEEARQFAHFLLSPRVQETIGRFGIDKYGQPLFFPMVEKRPGSRTSGLGRIRT